MTGEASLKRQPRNVWRLLTHGHYLHAITWPLAIIAYYAWALCVLVPIVLAYLGHLLWEHFEGGTKLFQPTVWLTRYGDYLNDMMKEQIAEAMGESPAAKGYPKKVVTSRTEMEESYFSSQLKKLEARIAAIESEKISLSKENEELKNALANEPAPHSKFSPEGSSTPKLKYHIGARREETITDRVFKQLFS